jgi:hypothetical protein
MGRKIRGSHQVTERLFTWQFLASAVVMVILVIAATTPAEFLTDLISDTAPGSSTDIPDPDSTQARLVTLDEALLEAARLRDEGERNLAHILYQEVLSQYKSRDLGNAQTAALLIEVGEFYIDGSEIGPEAIESLFQDAYVTAKPIVEEFEGFERIHLGLEKLYLKHMAPQRAAKQNRLLMHYYRQVFGKKPDELFALEEPVMMRLASNLVNAGQAEQARIVYARLTSLLRKRGLPTATIESLMANTYLPDAAGLSVTPANHPGSGPDTVNLEQIVRTSMPQGLAIEELFAEPGQLTFSGYTDSTAILAKYLREMMNQGAKPELRSVSDSVRGDVTVKAFTVIVSPE